MVIIVIIILSSSPEATRPNKTTGMTHGVTILDVCGLVRQDGQKSEDNALPKYECQRFVSILGSVIGCVLTHILYFLMTVIFTVSEPTYSQQGPILVPEESLCPAVSSSDQTLRNKPTDYHNGGNLTCPFVPFPFPLNRKHSAVRKQASASGKLTYLSLIWNFS